MVYSISDSQNFVYWLRPKANNVYCVDYTGFCVVDDVDIFPLVEEEDFTKQDEVFMVNKRNIIERMGLMKHEMDTSD